MIRMSGIALFVCSSLLAACGGGTATSSGPRAATQDPKQACVTFFQKQRACTDTFIPALVDERVKLDKPAGIADVEKQEGRDALIAKAMDEWKNDSQDPAISATCDKIVAGGDLVDNGDDCVAKDSCDEFTACAMPLIAPHLR